MNVLDNNNKQENCEKKEDLLELLKQTKYINIKCFKWLHKYNKKKYDEMFDYDTEKFRLSEYNIKNDCGTILDNFKILKYLDKVNLEENEEFLFVNSEENSERNFLKSNIVVTRESSKYTENNFIIKHNKYAYLVCKYYSEEGRMLSLNIGSILRIGKYILKILLLKTNNKLRFKNQIEPKEFLSSKFLPNEEINATCRICFYNDSEPGTKKDFLISICNCKGSVKYIHKICLEKWIKNKCQIEYTYMNPNFFKITIKNFSCEICKKVFPLVIRDFKTGEDYYLLNILKTKNNFIVLRNILVQDENSIEKVKDENFEFKDGKSENIIEYLYIEFSNYYKKNIIIGRDKKCDLILDDISVSRKHCMLYLDENYNDTLKVRDLESKFGTLIDMYEDIVINELNPKATLQKGNTVYHFNLKSIFM